MLLLNILQGIINAIDMPARQAFLVEMIEDRRDLSNAIALNSSMVNAARFLGPSIAGVLIAAVGEGWCFSSTLSATSRSSPRLLAMRVVLRPEPRRKGAGAHRAGRRRALRGKLCSHSCGASLGGAGQPDGRAVHRADARARGHSLGGGAHALGFLMAASGLGALGGALYLASRPSVVGLGRVIGIAAASFGVGLILFSRSHVLWLSMLLIFPTGMAMMTQMAASNTVLQSIVDDDKRGRVMSLFGVAFFGTVPFGSLLGGALATRIGVARHHRTGRCGVRARRDSGSSAPCPLCDARFDRSTCDKAFCPTIDRARLERITFSETARDRRTP